MRTFTTVSLSLLLVAGAFALEKSHEILAKRAVREAEEWVESSLKEAFASGAQSKRSTKYSPEAEEHDRNFNIYSRALELLTSNHNLSEKEAHRSLRQVSGVCQPPSATCSSASRYRTIDGTCNNLNTPWWGAARTFQNRLLNPVYADGRNSPRGGFGTALPNARFISTQCHPDFDIVFPGLSNMVPQFGQFLDHDLSLTPEAARQCCNNPSVDANCWNINVTLDNFFSSRGTRCLDFTRSTACSNPATGVREQMNMNTAFIDGSMIYGSSTTRANQLRSFQGGQLLTNNAGWNGFVPFANQNQQLASNNIQGAFIAGDDRINEMPGLAVMHNLFLMEHNRIARGLAQLRPAWSDETLYQETRRIVSAILQQIAYNEYLPIVLGDATMRANNLYLPAAGQFSTYDATVNPNIINSFSTAAYRFGHSLISGIINLFSVQGSQIGSYNIKDQYFQADQMTQSNGQGYDWILGGLMRGNAQNFDPFVTTGVTNFLFAPRGATVGSDLIARNIQRGRDHGLPNFNAFRQSCGRAPIDFNTQPADMDNRQWNVLKTCYASPNDIDLFSGGLHELPVPGGASGFTFNCIKAIQFRRLKDGDRYFFTHGNVPNAFTSAQVAEIRRRTLGDVICQNSQQLSTQRNVFLIPSGTNPQVACNDASRNKLNLSLFVQ